MQFKVPQFVEIEDKIIGPLSLKQFLYVLAGTGLLFIFWFILNLWAFIIVAIPIAGFCALLVFYKFEGRPFISLLSSLIKYFSKPKLYLWRRK
ncbi:MAG: PrgI family protein [bacterium]